MKIDFDPAKDRTNIEKHGYSLKLAERFEWDEAYSRPDLRKDYGEVRISALGYVDFRLFAVIYTDRDDVRRIISLRKASAREEKLYAQT